MNERIRRLEDEVRYVLGIASSGKTPVHAEVLAVAAEMEEKDETIKALADALMDCTSDGQCECDDSVGHRCCWCRGRDALLRAGCLTPEAFEGQT